MIRVDIEVSLGNFHLKAKWSFSDGILAIVGPSGAGKTTTLRAIAGLLKPQKGTISFNGTVFFSSQEGVDLPPQKRMVGYLPQNHLLFPHMTVLKNVTYGGCKDRAWVEYVIEKTGIERLLKRYPHQLSGGEAQRVAVARALAVKPRLLLLDEPFSNMHPELRGEMLDFIRETSKEFGIRIVVVTHLTQEIRRVADKIVSYDIGWGVEDEEACEG